MSFLSSDEESQIKRVVCHETEVTKTISYINKLF